MRRVRVQVITYAPTAFFHCLHCELTFQHMGLGERLRRDEARDALPDDLREEYGAVSEWIHDLVHRFGDRLRVRLVDAASIEGFFKSLVHRARQYPAIVVEGGPAKYVGTDLAEARQVIERYMTAPAN
jgi:hypothetical protein